MVEIVVPLGVLAIMSLMLMQVCRLISQAILNRTIRKALEVDPASARLLIDKLEPRARSSAGLIGWVMIVAGIAIGALGFIEKTENYSDSISIATVSVVTGMGILLYSWWIGRLAPDVEQIDAK